MGLDGGARGERFLGSGVVGGVTASFFWDKEGWTTMDFPPKVLNAGEVTSAGGGEGNLSCEIVGDDGFSEDCLSSWLLKGCECDISALS